MNFSQNFLLFLREQARTTKGMPSSPVVRGEAPGEVTAQSDSSSSNSESGGTGIISGITKLI